MEDQPQIVENDDKKASPVRARRIRIYPTKEQQATIKTWLGAVRWTYNQTVNHLNQAEKVDKSIKTIRARFVNHDTIGNASPQWFESIPYDIRDEGARDAKKAISSNMAKQRKRKKEGKSFNFRLSFRRKHRACQETLVVHSKHWRHQRGPMFDLLGQSGHKLNASEPLPETLDYDSRLIRTRLNEYYLCIPMGPDENQVCDQGTGVASLDPGVRTFMTVYDAESVVEWGPGDTTRIHRLCQRLDHLYKRCAEVNHRTRYKLRRAALKIRRKIRNLVDDAHRKLTKWLCQNYQVVLIPLFETQQMVRRGHRRLNSKTARALCTWSHYRFRQSLISRAQSYNTVVVETTEEFTSKTCGQCGTINSKLGGKKTFACEKCNFRSDRDFNGARNILIRHLTKQSVVL